MVQAGDAAQPAARSGFFFWMAVLLLALLVIGFAPSFFLRVVFDSDGHSMPAYLHVHGIVLTSWYVLLVVQTGLVRYGRIATHRTLGMAGAALAAAVCYAAPLATFNLVSTFKREGLDWTTDMSALPKFGVECLTMEQFAGLIIFNNLLGILAFAILVVAAVAVRRRKESHKRFMLLASIVLFPPVLARFARWEIFGGEDSPFIPFTLLALLAAVIVHDRLTHRRVHRATIAGIGVIVVTSVAAQVLALSPFGAAFVRSFG